MRCDLHVHTFHSGMSDLAVLRWFCRECYTPPEILYSRLKRAGMHLVTVTDHDSIEAAEVLGRKDDFFSSEEVTCHLPSGTVLHLGVYDLNERQHVEIQQRRDDLSRLLAYLNEQNLFFSVQHPFSSLTGRREREDFECLETWFPAFEVLNGHVIGRANEEAQRMAARLYRTVIAGSDAHTLRSAASAYTEVAGARNKQEFLAGLRQGRGRIQGNGGSFWKLTLEAFWIAEAFFQEFPATRIFTPLLGVIPIFTFLNYCREEAFVERWGRELARRPAARLGCLTREVLE